MSQEARIILQTVQQLCTGGRWSNNFTLNYFVDIMKGSKLKKIMDNGKIDYLFIYFYFIFF